MNRHGQRAGVFRLYPEGFDPHELLDSAFNIIFDEPFDARIRFSPGQTRYIRERRWAKDQEFIDEVDGSVVLAMRTSGRDEVKRWVLPFGPTAEVLEPAELRAEVKQEFEAAARRYD